jgi:hypothetical protein
VKRQAHMESNRHKHETTEVCSARGARTLNGHRPDNKVLVLLPLAVMMTSTTTGKRSTSFRAAMCSGSDAIRRIIPANRQVLKLKAGKKILGVRQQAGGRKFGGRRQVAGIR